jgi:hypothetical protein
MMSGYSVEDMHDSSNQKAFRSAVAEALGVGVRYYMVDILNVCPFTYSYDANERLELSFTDACPRRRLASHDGRQRQLLQTAQRVAMERMEGGDEFVLRARDSSSWAMVHNRFRSRVLVDNTTSTSASSAADMSSSNSSAASGATSGATSGAADGATTSTAASTTASSNSTTASGTTIAASGNGTTVGTEAGGYAYYYYGALTREEQLKKGAGEDDADGNSTSGTGGVGTIGGDGAGTVGGADGDGDGLGTGAGKGTSTGTVFNYNSNFSGCVIEYQVDYSEVWLDERDNIEAWMDCQNPSKLNRLKCGGVRNARLSQERWAQKLLQQMPYYGLYMRKSDTLTVETSFAKYVAPVYTNAPTPSSGGRRGKVKAVFESDELLDDGTPSGMKIAFCAILGAMLLRVVYGKVKVCLDKEKKRQVRKRKHHERALRMGWVKNAENPAEDARKALMAKQANGGMAGAVSAANMAHKLAA